MFWRLINARRKKSNSGSGSELIFNGRHCNTSAGINCGWANYFAGLYTPTRAAHFDEEFSDTIRNEMEIFKTDIESSPEVDKFPVISFEEVESALNRQRVTKPVLVLV